MARKTMKDVEFYVTLLNDRLASMHKGMEYYVKERNGYKALELVDFEGRVKWVRTGFTTGQIYEVVYSMYEMLCRF